MTVAVIGGGMAGCAAALELARRGVEAVVVRAGPGATALGAGTLEVAGASPLAGELPLRDPLRGTPLAPRERLQLLLRTGPSHPYTRLLQPASPEAACEELARAVRTLDEWLAPVGLRIHGDLGRTSYLADVRGSVRAADFALAGPAQGELTQASEIALVALPSLEGYDARPVARQLAAELAAVGLGPRPLRVVSLGSPDEAWLGEAKPARIAAELDRGAALARLRERLAPHGGSDRLLLLPPVLGLERTEAILAALREACGGPVGELLAAVPHPLAGYRLDRALMRALDRAGVETVRGSAERVEGEEGCARRIRVAAPEGEHALEADAVVLATGRFVGGGLVEEDGRLREPLLGLPLVDAEGRRVDGLPAHRLVRPDYAEPQPIFAAGVPTDGRLRPLGSDGRPLWRNVFAAGDLLGGFDPARERTGLGVALLTGLRAGMEAARWVKRATQGAES